MNRTNNYKKLINSRKWTKLRAAKMQSSPQCEICAVAGIITPGTEVHHITPIDIGANDMERTRLAYDMSNLQTLCHKCHVIAHVELQSKSAKQTQARNKAKRTGFVDQFLSDKK